MKPDEKVAKKRLFIKNLKEAFARQGIDTGHGFAAFLAHKYKVTPASSGEWLNEHKSFPSRQRLEMIAGDTDITVDELLNGLNNNIEDGPDLQSRIPIIGFTTAGAFKHVRELEPHEVDEYVDSTYKQNGYRFALRIKGKSMENPADSQHIPDGSIVIFNREKRDPVSGQLVLAKINGRDEITFKRFIRDGSDVFLEPLNPRYNVITDEFRVLATAEEMTKRL